MTNTQKEFDLIHTSYEFQDIFKKKSELKILRGVTVDAVSDKMLKRLKMAFSPIGMDAQAIKTSLKGIYTAILKCVKDYDAEAHIYDWERRRMSTEEDVVRQKDRTLEES